MLSLNTPELEIQLELALIANGNPQEVEKLVKAGWGIYPQVLNALVCLGHTTYLHRILKAAGEYERYPVNEMQAWMEAYYEKNWRFQVLEFGFEKIAEVFLSYEECEKAGFHNAVQNKNKRCSWAIIADTDGIEVVKKTYLRLHNELTQGSPIKEKERVADIEHFLLSRGEYAFLYERQCWRTLSLSLDGCKYISEIRCYMNGLAECVLSHSTQMDEDTLAYCVSILDKAHLDDHYGPRYREWKATHQKSV